MLMTSRMLRLAPLVVLLFATPALAAKESAKEKLAKTHYQMGEGLYQEGKYAEANREFWATLHSDTSSRFANPKSGRIAGTAINHLRDEVTKGFWDHALRITSDPTRAGTT